MSFTFQENNSGSDGTSHSTGIGYFRICSGARPEPVQLIRIAEHAGLSQPTTANIVKTLLQQNYLEQLGRKTGYRLGVAAYRLTGNTTYGQDLSLAAKEPMAELTAALNETSLLAVIRNNKRVVLHLVECNQTLVVRTLMVAEVYDTSTGRLLMAYMTQTELEKLIKAVGLPSKKTWPGAETKGGLQRALNQIREKEFVQIHSVHHTVGFAVPVYKEEAVVAGLSIFIPESRYTDANRDKLVKLLRRTAKKISETLNGSGIGTVR